MSSGLGRSCSGMIGGVEIVVNVGGWCGITGEVDVGSWIGIKV